MKYWVRAVGNHINEQLLVQAETKEQLRLELCELLHTKVVSVSLSTNGIQDILNDPERGTLITQVDIVTELDNLEKALCDTTSPNAQSNTLGAAGTSSSGSAAASSAGSGKAGDSPAQGAVSERGVGSNSKSPASGLSPSSSTGGAPVGSGSTTDTQQSPSNGQIKSIVLSRERAAFLLDLRFGDAFHEAVQGCFARVKEKLGGGYVICPIVQVHNETQLLLDFTYYMELRHLDSVSNGKVKAEEVVHWFRQQVTAGRNLPQPEEVARKCEEVLEAERTAVRCTQTGASPRGPRQPPGPPPSSLPPPSGPSGLSPGGSFRQDIALAAIEKEKERELAASGAIFRTPPTVGRLRRNSSSGSLNNANTTGTSPSTRGGAGNTLVLTGVGARIDSPVRRSEGNSPQHSGVGLSTNLFSSTQQQQSSQLLAQSTPAAAEREAVSPQAASVGTAGGDPYGDTPGSELNAPSGGGQQQLQAASGSNSSNTLRSALQRSSFTAGAASTAGSGTGLSLMRIRTAGPSIFSAVEPKKCPGSFMFHTNDHLVHVGIVSRRSDGNLLIGTRWSNHHAKVSRKGDFSGAYWQLGEGFDPTVPIEEGDICKKGYKLFGAPVEWKGQYWGLGVKVSCPPATVSTTSAGDSSLGGVGCGSNVPTPTKSETVVHVAHAQHGESSAESSVPPPPPSTPGVSSGATLVALSGPTLKEIGSSEIFLTIPSVPWMHRSFHAGLQDLTHGGGGGGATGSIGGRSGGKHNHHRQYMLVSTADELVLFWTVPVVHYHNRTQDGVAVARCPDLQLREWTLLSQAGPVMTFPHGTPLAVAYMSSPKPTWILASIDLHPLQAALAAQIQMTASGNVLPSSTATAATGGTRGVSPPPNPPSAVGGIQPQPPSTEATHPRNLVLSPEALHQGEGEDGGGMDSEPSDPEEGLGLNLPIRIWTLPAGELSRTTPQEGWNEVLLPGSVPQPPINSSNVLFLPPTSAASAAGGPTAAGGASSGGSRSLLSLCIDRHCVDYLLQQSQAHAGLADPLGGATPLGLGLTSVTSGLFLPVAVEGPALHSAGPCNQLPPLGAQLPTVLPPLAPTGGGAAALGPGVGSPASTISSTSSTIGPHGYLASGQVSLSLFSTGGGRFYVGVTISHGDACIVAWDRLPVSTIFLVDGGSTGVTATSSGANTPKSSAGRRSPSPDFPE